MFSPTDGPTTRYEKVSFNSANDDHDIWANPYTTNFLNFGREGSGVQVVGGEAYADHLMTFTTDKVFPVYTTPNATLPFAFQKDIFSEEGGGPIGAHAIVSANQRLYWLSQNLDIKQQTGFEVNSVGYNLQPFLRGLSKTRLAFTVGGWSSKYRLVLWAVSDGTDTQHQDVIGFQVDTGQFYLFTLQVNALAARVVSTTDQRLIGGHYNGLFSNLFDGSTTGDLQTAASVIDADTITTRINHGQPGVFKKIPYYGVFFDPIGTESVTIQHRFNDETSWTAADVSPVVMSGTDTKIAYVGVPAPYESIQIRIRDNNSGERYRVTKIGFPRPLSTYMSVS